MKRNIQYGSAYDLRADSPFSELMESELAESAAEQQEKAKADMMTEQRILVARALRGDKDAFDDIFDQYSGLMLRTAYGIVKDRDSAEDAVQNALIQAWQHLPSLRETEALRSWLLRIVVNQCISFKRRLARSRMFLSQSFSEQETYLASQIADVCQGSHGAQLGSRASSSSNCLRSSKMSSPSTTIKE